MNEIFIQELKKLSHLRTENLSGRVVNLMPYWDGKDWHMWFQTDQGKLQHMRPLDAAKTSYLGGALAKEGDLYIPFVDLMWQRASYKEVVPLISAICDDFYNMSVSLAKIQHIFDTKDLIKSMNAGAFVATEIEYILMLSRAVFDLLYKIINCLWSKYVRLGDPDAEKDRTSKKLPDSLSKFLLNGDNLRTCLEIQKKYAVPKDLAEEFFVHAPFFLELRYLRNKVVHSGSSLDSIFVTEKGFCVLSDKQPFSKFYAGLDCSPYTLRNNLVSLLPWLSQIIFGTIHACNSISFKFSSVILLPEAIAPELRVFIRDPSGDSLIRAHKAGNGGYPWWDIER